MQSIVVINKPKDWKFQIQDVEVVSAKAYLTDLKYSEISNLRVYNLCQSYRYQGIGYYVSLLAEARGHRSFPNITTIQDLKSQSIVRIISDELDKRIQSSFSRIRSNRFDLNIYFGKSVAKQYEQLSKQLYNLFPAPLLSVSFIWNEEQKKWLLQNIFPLPLSQIPELHKPYLLEFAREYFGRKRIHSTSGNSKLVYDLAILVNPEEKSPPSDRKALNKFIEAAEDAGMRARLITKNDYSRIPEFDALFIRETTSVNHHTYRFARRASAENLVVMDDPVSIVRCANKVYMAEVMRKANIPTPKTVIVHKKNADQLVNELGLPYVLKQPDGSFSSGVMKVKDQLDLDESLNRLLNQSDLIIAQEYVPTEFDWRIGILNKMPLYACKYFMAKNHWQINQWQANGSFKVGAHQSVRLEDVPQKVLNIAKRAASLIGDGLYGVDIKQIDNKVMVIEVNDNPNIDFGTEDGILKDQLYKEIMEWFSWRMKSKLNKS
ncbi:MAG: glutathione synthase [Gammaproteobacteria bacterium RIFCSPHIGHO2_12_FULL_43_28]|nr:MAG: glutathione synthase [Gammaproteobacteria bacterium RIFCSPHIGHO2_12_FULL_43_28]